MSRSFLETVKEHVEQGASQEDYLPVYAEQQINAMSNYEFLELLSDALDWTVIPEGE